MFKHSNSLTLLLVAITFVFGFSTANAQQNPAVQKGKKKQIAPPENFTPQPVKIERNLQLPARQAPSKQYQSLPPLQKTGPASPSPLIRHKSVKTVPTASAPIFIESEVANTARIDRSSPENMEHTAKDYMKSIAHLMRSKNVEQEWSMIQNHTDQFGTTHVKFQQYYQGIPIYASEAIVHLSDNGERVLNGRYHATPDMEVPVQNLSDGTAEQVALADLAKITHVVDLTTNQQQLLEYHEPARELVLLANDDSLGKFNLVWHLTVRPNWLERWEYFVDATNGEIIDKYNHTCAIMGPATGSGTDLHGANQSFSVWEDGGTYYMVDGSQTMFNSGQSNMPDDPVGAIWTIDAQDTDLDNTSHVSSGSTSFNDPVAVSAHVNGTLCYEYFKNTHNRNSIDGQGGTIISAIHVTSGGSPMDNAYWNGQVMAYGDGDQAFTPLAGSLDVAAHEMSHGVISKTANLEYKNQSGALNESIADCFGVMVDRDDWQLGDDISSTQYFPSGALRDMQDPHNGGSSMNDNGYQPKTMSEFEDLNEWQDNGGVHVNSGIPNHAFYLFATATSKSTAEDVWYHALTSYLTRSSQFIDMRIAMIQSAKDIYGAQSTQATEAGNAFDGVEIFDANGGSYEVDLNQIEGAEGILSIDVDSTNSNTIYLSSTTPDNYQALSQTKVKNKPSVTDDGSVGVFVKNNDNSLVLFNLDPGNVNEQVIQDQDCWDNVAISKDGSKLAAISCFVDAAIWVYDFNSSTWHEFTLYNPTFDSTLTTGGPLYADAIEWDYSGEYLIYDAFNRINTNTGTDIEYWNVGFIRVWNWNINDFGDGKITNMFSNLPDDVSIGNPVFSKNSPYIVAYDYWDNNTGDIKVQATNTETGETGEIFNNTILGYPNFSNTDGEMIFNALDTNNDTIVGKIGLASDKINPSGNADVFVPLAKWGIWYAQGYRVSVEEVANHRITDPSLQLFPNPAKDLVIVKMQLADNTNIRMELVNTLGQRVKVSQFDNQPKGLFQQALDIKGLSAGVYFLNINQGDGKAQQTLRLVKTKE